MLTPSSELNLKRAFLFTLFVFLFGNCVGGDFGMMRWTSISSNLSMFSVDLKLFIEDQEIL